jgi:hypothetical protein
MPCAVGIEGAVAKKTIIALWETKFDGDLKIKDAIPLGYWETCDARQSGLITGVNEDCLRVHSPANLRVGGELSISVFYSLGNEFDKFQALTKIVAKDLFCDEGWEAYEYELEFNGISEPDRLKLRNLIYIFQVRSIYS